MKSQPKEAGTTASKLISERIAELGDWRGDTLARVRALIRSADPDVVEEWKWMGTPVWSHDWGICTGESYKSIVKLTFFKGASLKDRASLFNSSLDGNTRRAIDIHEGEEIDANAFQTLVRAAVSRYFWRKEVRETQVIIKRNLTARAFGHSSGLTPCERDTRGVSRAPRAPPHRSPRGMANYIHRP